MHPELASHARFSADVTHTHPMGQTYLETSAIRQHGCGTVPLRAKDGAPWAVNRAAKMLRLLGDDESAEKMEKMRNEVVMQP